MTPGHGLYTSEDQLRAMLKDVAISSDGTCAWSRPGQLTSLCSMEGLQDFPFDILTCNLRFGGWSLSDKYQNLSLMQPAVTLISDDFDSFREYSLLRVTSSSAVCTCTCAHVRVAHVQMCVRLHTSLRTVYA